MPDTDDRARDEGRHAIDAAVMAMVRATGAEIAERRGVISSMTIRDATAADGIRFALILQSAAAQKVRAYIQQARKDGLTWAQIGEALNLGPVAEEQGVSLGGAAFDYATDAGHASPFQTLSFGWTCPSCGRFVSERGPDSGHPADCEPGHKEGCTRLAAAVAEYEAMWEDQ